MHATASEGVKAPKHEENASRTANRDADMAPFQGNFLVRSGEISI